MSAARWPPASVRHGDFLDSIGTTECLFVALDRPLEDAAMGRQGYTQGAHARERSYVYGGLYTAGICYDWIRQACAPDVPHEELLARAEAVAPGSLGVTFIPHLRLSNTPNMDSQARGAFIGLTTDAGTAELTRAVLEGVAFEGRASIEPLLRYAGLPPIDGRDRGRRHGQERASAADQGLGDEHAACTCSRSRRRARSARPCSAGLRPAYTRRSTMPFASPAHGSRHRARSRSGRHIRHDLH